MSPNATAIDFSTYVDWLAIVYAFTNVASPAISIPAGFTGRICPSASRSPRHAAGKRAFSPAAKLLENVLGLGQITPIDPRPGH